MRRHRSITWVLAAIYGALLLALGWSRYATCHNHTFDLALYARTAWGLARGDMWNPIANSTFVHLHTAWALLPLGLIGRAFGVVPVLLLAQSLAIALCLWPLTRIATRHLGAVGVWVAPLLWIAYPNLGHVGSYEMHPGTLALLPLCWALDALDRNAGRTLMWCCLGVVACRADYAMLTAVMGVLLATASATQRRRGVSIAVASVGYLALVLGAQHVLVAHGVQSSTLHFGPWGGSPLGIVGAAFTDSARVVDHLSSFDRLAYLPRLLLPLALVPLLHLRLLWIAAPVFAINLISVWPSATRLDSHYLAPAVPVLIVSALIGAARLRVMFPRASQFWLLAPVAASAWFGGLPWSMDFPREAFVTDARTAACSDVLQTVNASASVQAPDFLLPHLAERAVLHRGPPPERGADVIVLDASHRSRFAHNEDLLRTVEEPSLRSWIARSDYGVTYNSGDLIVMERGQSTREGIGTRYIDHARASDTLPTHRLTACLSIDAAHLTDTTLTLELRAHEPCAPDLAIRIGSTARPKRADLLFDGVLSPVHVRQGDRLRSIHKLSRTEAATIGRSGLWVGALRSSGARPVPSDPIALQIPVKQAP